jgi:hypothetical protein
MSVLEISETATLPGGWTLHVLWREAHNPVQLVGRLHFPWTNLVEKQTEGIFWLQLVGVRWNAEVIQPMKGWGGSATVW